MAPVRTGAEKKRYSSQISRTATATSTRYAAPLSTKCIVRRRPDNPKATTHASKLIQTRRNVSGRMCRMSCAPTGTPMARLGRICGMSAMLPREYRPAKAYATAGQLRSPSDGQDVRVEHEFNRHQRRVQYAVGEEQQRDGNGDGREPVPKGAVDRRGQQRDPDERDCV